MGRVRRSCPPGKHQVTSVKGNKFCRETVYGENSRTGNTGPRKVRKDKGSQRGTSSTFGIWKGKALHKSSRGAVFYYNKSNKKTYISSKLRATGRL